MALKHKFKKCLKEAFVPTPSENTENSTPDSDISSYPEDKKQELAAVSETLPMIAAVPTSTRSPSPAVSESKKILSISPSKAVLVAKTPLPSLTFFKAEKSKKKNRQLPRAAAYSY
ncbi:MAG: hypothetical protein IPJ69_08540 [Deltaproteobacteria bacterium]|nr:MAG: hypothetical protein IPJ69_08540 [Deltaproteobacteria bacterium]